MPAADVFDWENADYYTLLGIGPGAEIAEIRKAYRRLAKLHHPDRYPLDSPEREAAAERFKALAVALETLTDPERRAAYDAEQALVDHWRYRALQYQIEIPPRPDPVPQPRYEDDEDDEPASFIDELRQAADGTASDSVRRGISDASKRSAANAYYTQGLRYYGYGQYDKAMRFFMLAMQLDPSRQVSPHVWARLVRYSYGWD